MEKIIWQGIVSFSDEEFAKLVSDAICVKRSPVREVLHSGRYFIKHDLRRRVDFKKEFDNARYLEQLGVPVVKHLAYGESEDGAYLVTEALEGAVELGDFCSAGVPEKSFMLNLVSFIRNMARVKLRHRDLHPGNVLYVPSDGSFALVDVREVKRNTFWHPFRKREFFELLTGVRDNLPESEILHYLELAGCSDPEKFLVAEEKRKLAALKLRWLRRREQILTGYPKFTRIEGGMLINRDAGIDDLSGAITESASEAEFLAYYYLRLSHIPTVKVLGYDRNEAKLLLPESSGYSPATPEAVAGFLPRLSRIGITSSAEDFRLAPDGRVVFVNLKLAAKLLW